MGSVFGLPITTGSMMERSKIPLNKWLMAMHLMGVEQKGLFSPSIASHARHYLPVGLVPCASHP